GCWRARFWFALRRLLLAIVESSRSDRRAGLGGIAEVLLLSEWWRGVSRGESEGGGQARAGTRLEVVPGNEGHLDTRWQRSRRALIRVVIRRHDHARPHAS